MVNINKRKAIKFYSEVMSLYPQRESLWGKETEFIDSLKNPAYNNKEYEVDFQKLRISFSKPIFDILFSNNAAIEFNKPIGQRLEFKNYIYLELKESPLINLNSKENSGLFSLSKTSFHRKRHYWGFFFINEDKKEHLYYPKEILPIFISQLKARLVKDYFSNVDTGVDIYINFCTLFKSLRYILRVKKGKKALLEKLLYRLCADLGLIEHRIQAAFKIDVQQDINGIYDKTTNTLLLSNKKQYNIDSLKFYISAMENSDPCYQFLELYHSLESYFYKYFYEYIKSLKKVKTRKDFKQIRNATDQREMLKLVIRDVSDELYYLRNELNNINGLDSFCENILGDTNLANWNESDTESFSNHLSKFISFIRNNIVHTRESDKAMVNLNENEKDVLMEINKTLFTVVKKVFDKNIKW